MTTTQVTGLGWIRGVEDRYPSTMDSSLDWGTYDRLVSGDFLSGMVVSLTNGNQVVKADTSVNSGAFRGIMFTEKSADLDESLGGAPPTVIVGGATLFIYSKALVSGQSYAAGNYLTVGTSGTAGRLVPGGSAGVARVGIVQAVQTDGILMRLFPPSI